MTEIAKLQLYDCHWSSLMAQIQFWVSCVFLCVPSQMGGMEAVITGLSDDFKILKRNRKLFTFATAFGTFLFALLCVTNVSMTGCLSAYLLIHEYLNSKYCFKYFTFVIYFCFVKHSWHLKCKGLSLMTWCHHETNSFKEKDQLW